MARGGPKLDHGRRQELGQSFQDGGEHYERVRPGYPAESADWLIPAGARDALDVGAGTGKFTALLLDRGLAVAAVDPSTDMLDQLRVLLPGVPATEGTAEATGLARLCLRRRERGAGLALVRSDRCQYGTFAGPPHRRNAGADLEPAGYFRSLGSPAFPHHARRGRLPAALPAARGAGVRRAGKPCDALGGRAHH